MSKVVEDFKNYLITLGYSEHISYEVPRKIIFFLKFIDEEKGKTLSKVNSFDVDSFMDVIINGISEKTLKKRGNMQINDYIYSLKHFNKYLFNIHNRTIPITHIEYLKENRIKKSPLLISEVKALFNITDNTKYGMRDRAMLTIYYSCGLRRNEGVNVETTDIDLKKRILFVKEGKYGKQRYVPFTEQSKKYLEDYIYNGRRQFINKSSVKRRKTLFISKTGEKLTSQSLYIRVKLLGEKAKIKREIGLHLLRHSIATHLLHNGMSVYDIATFLGHSSIETTQIYTHVTEDDFL